MFCSVIIPTYRDNKRLNKCIAALENQSLDNKFFEVLVINNSPDTILTVKKSNLNIRYLEETKPGSYAARNKGIKEAKGSILAFTDSDCLPDENWLKCGAAAIEFGEEDRIAGHIDVFSSSAKMSAVECYESIFAFNQIQNAKSGVSVTANLLVKAELFKYVGLFDDNLFSGGDIEWNHRATKMEYKIKYAKNTVVRHPARRTWSEMSQKLRRTTEGKIASLPDYKLSAFKSFFPPVEAASHIVRHNKSNLRTKLLSLMIAYRIKIYRYSYFYKLKPRQYAPKRV